MSEIALDIGRRLARRRMATVSFGVLVVETASVTAFLLLSPHRTEVAAALGVAAPLITGMMSVHAAIVLGYMGVSVAEKVMGAKNADSR